MAIFLKTHPWSSPNIPVLYLIFWHQTTRAPQVGRSLPQSEMLHFNLSAISDSISVLQPLTGVFKVGPIEINHDVAENIEKVMAHRLDKELRPKVEVDVSIRSNFDVLKFCFIPMLILTFIL